ncbi:signal peptidase I [Enterococcus sp. 8G7_MSG3316]|uniref:Signal peptidase I n=2 Tax=Candidatus Enterococcus testudinis TaxID=1834191 RepID=A0A242A254_9ENTE|nr:signal peptidase I [Enterococcus sp. 8G7_MSG3316]
MQPTLNSGNRAFALKISSNLSRGDIIIFEYDQKIYVKRIIGTPGDKLVFTNNEIKINNKLLEEEYLITYPENTDFLNDKESIELEVPQKSFFVLGDNRLNSIDSREFGVISEDRIVGKIFFTYDFKVF